MLLTKKVVILQCTHDHQALQCTHQEKYRYYSVHALTKRRVTQLLTHYSCIPAVPAVITDCSPSAFNADFHSAQVCTNTTPQLHRTISAFGASS